MISDPKIQFVSRDRLDAEKYNSCIDESGYELIYPKSYFLDAMAADWSVLANKEYQWVLPLTHKQKWGINYLYQPPFTQQTGIFAKPGIVVPYEAIFEWLKSHFKFCEVNWNNRLPSSPSTCSVIRASLTNYILDLLPGYAHLSTLYHKDLKKNLKKAHAVKLTYSRSMEYKRAIALFKKHYSNRTPHVTDKDYLNFEKFVTRLFEQGKVICREVIDGKGILLANCLMLFENNRLYNMMNTTTETGRKLAANHFLIDRIIEEFAGRSITLDFEGSDLPGVASFYKNFGGTNSPYYHIKYNNLPWLFRLFKK